MMLRDAQKGAPEQRCFRSPGRFLFLLLWQSANLSILSQKAGAVSRGKAVCRTFFLHAGRGFSSGHPGF